MTFSTEEAINQPMGGKFIDDATNGNWAQVTSLLKDTQAKLKSSDSKSNKNVKSIPSSVKKPSQSVPACTSLGCKTDSNSKYTLPMKEPDEKTIYYPTGLPVDEEIKTTQKKLEVY
jgi:hypothetical protein